MLSPTARIPKLGEAKRRQYSRKMFLEEHQWCAYCGSPATTTDHCPPRCFFRERIWPETYEFPACEACNEGARLDEQVLALLIRVTPTENSNEIDNIEWRSAVSGVQNNNPALIEEWFGTSASFRKRKFRQKFGPNGDSLRYQGAGLIRIGPMTTAIIDRFVIKLGKALYYKHNGALFDGYIQIGHVNLFDHPQIRSKLDDILKYTPLLSEIKRNNKSLSDRFQYWYDHNQELEALAVVARFSDQLVFQLIAMGNETQSKVAAGVAAVHAEAKEIRGYRCPLKFNPAKSLPPTT